MNQMLREKCASLTQQRDRQLTEVRRLEAELYRVRQMWEASHTALWNVHREAILELVSLKEQLDDKSNTLREQPY